MIQIVPQLRIRLAYRPVDFRKGIDGLIALCRQELASDPYDGSLYVFRNRRSTDLRILDIGENPTIFRWSALLFE